MPCQPKPRESLENEKKKKAAVNLNDRRRLPLKGHGSGALYKSNTFPCPHPPLIITYLLRFHQPNYNLGFPWKARTQTNNLEKEEEIKEIALFHITHGFIILFQDDGLLPSSLPVPPSPLYLRYMLSKIQHVTWILFSMISFLYSDDNVNRY